MLFYCQQLRGGIDYPCFDEGTEPNGIRTCLEVTQKTIKILIVCWR